MSTRVHMSSQLIKTWALLAEAEADTGRRCPQRPAYRFAEFSGFQTFCAT